MPSRLVSTSPPHSPGVWLSNVVGSAASSVHSTSFRPALPGLFYSLLPVLICSLLTPVYLGWSVIMAASSSSTVNTDQNEIGAYRTESVPVQVTTIRLTKENYLKWSAAITMGIAGRCRIAYVNESKVEPVANSMTWDTWFLEDNQVKTWIVNSVSSDIQSLILRKKTARDMWIILEQMYGQKKRKVRVYQLMKDVGRSSSGKTPVSEDTKSSRGKASISAEQIRELRVYLGRIDVNQVEALDETKANHALAIVGDKGNSYVGEWIVDSGATHHMTEVGRHLCQNLQIHMHSHFQYGRLCADIFRSGMLKSATDFQVYEEVAGLSGLDFAYGDYSAVYHTKNDKMKLLKAGSLQHLGENMLAFLLKGATSLYLPELRGDGLIEATLSSMRLPKQLKVVTLVLGMVLPVLISAGSVIRLLGTLIAIMVRFDRYRYGYGCGYRYWNPGGTPEWLGNAVVGSCVAAVVCLGATEVGEERFSWIVRRESCRRSTPLKFRHPSIVRTVASGSVPPRNPRCIKIRTTLGSVPPRDLHYLGIHAALGFMPPPRDPCRLGIRCRLGFCAVVLVSCRRLHLLRRHFYSRFRRRSLWLL
ncbi:hypothetical protein EJ110_NYTH46961 [Nymphaea thermarum]|nr:hypothetical protein EJ110_NYTH46961 [Nymphaea thermarum]